MTDRALSLTTEEVRAVLSRSKSRHTIPVKVWRNGKKVPVPPQAQEITPQEWMSPTENRPALGGYPRNCALLRWDGHSIGIPSPLGKPGDRVWVREAWMPGTCISSTDKSREGERSAAYKQRDGHLKVSWRSGATMPRWASRITLEIITVKVLRVQEISEWEANCHGDPKQGLIASEYTHTDWFQAHWNTKHPKQGWDQNPFCWSYEWKVRS